MEVNTPYLHIRALSKTYRSGVQGCIATARALDDVHVDVRQGEIVALIGPQGAGKTTLLLCAAGLLEPDGGTIDRVPSTAYFRDVVHAKACADRPIYDLTLIDNVDRVHGDVAAAFALVSAVRCAREFGNTLLLAAREARTVETIADRILLMERGRLRLSAPIAYPSVSARVAEIIVR